MNNPIENKNYHSANAVPFKSKRIMFSTFKNLEPAKEKYLSDLFREIGPQLDELSEGVHVLIRADDTDLLFTASKQKSLVPFIGWMLEVKNALALQRLDTNLSIEKFIQNSTRQNTKRNLEELPLSLVTKDGILATFKRVAEGTRALLADIENNATPRDYVKINQDFTDAGL